MKGRERKIRNQNYTTGQTCNIQNQHKQHIDLVILKSPVHKLAGGVFLSSVTHQ